jgi:hypothetical protein
MQIKLDGMHVMVGMPLYGAPTTKTQLSLLKSQELCNHNDMRFDFTTATGFVTVARDQIVADFLKSDAEKLFWIDGDMVWGQAEFAKMLALSTQVDLICATYPMKKEGPNQYPILCEPEVVTGPFGLMEIYGAGLGFSVWSRKACQALSDSKPWLWDGMLNEKRRAIFGVEPRPLPYPCPDPEVTLGMRTEDINAFEDLRALGFKVWLDPTIELGHIGSKEWRGSLSEYKETA